MDIEYVPRTAIVKSDTLRAVNSYSLGIKL